MTRHLDCPDCGGKGRTDVDGQTRWGVYEKWIDCPTCGGNGVLLQDPFEDVPVMEVK